MKINGCKTALILCFTALLASTTLLGLYSMNLSAKLDAHVLSVDNRDRVIEVLGRLLVEGGHDYSQQDVRRFLDAAYPDANIVEREGFLGMEYNAFDFDDGRLVRVQ